MTSRIDPQRNPPLLMSHANIATLPMDARVAVFMIWKDGMSAVVMPRDDEQRKLAFSQIFVCDNDYPDLMTSIVYADAEKVLFATDDETLQASVIQHFFEDKRLAMMFHPKPHIKDGWSCVETEKILTMNGPCSLYYWRGELASSRSVSFEQKAVYQAAKQISNFDIQHVFFMTCLDEAAEPFIMVPGGAEMHLMLWSMSLLAKKQECIVCAMHCFPLVWCGKCRARGYCSKQCQKQDWSAGHKSLCHLYSKSLRNHARETVKVLANVAAGKG